MGRPHGSPFLRRGYLGRLIGNPRAARYLDQHHLEILSEFNHRRTTSGPLCLGEVL
jgi:hypothetical protein